MKIGIIGSGYVGEATGKLLNELGNEIIFYDIVDKKIEDFKFTKNLEDIVNNSDLIFICVPTPASESGQIDLKILENVCENLADIYIKLNLNIPIVIKSTVVPGTAKKISKDIFKSKGINISFGSNPEFITEISGSWTKNVEMIRDWSSEDKIVIGCDDEKIKHMLNKIYEKFYEKIINTDTKTAEFIKYASNYCLASKISFFNELYLISKELGIDNSVVVNSLIKDPRIGIYGSINGKAYGGKCLPKDTLALQKHLIDKLETPVLDSTIKINEIMEKKYGKRE
mgnify:CR=1 FL=1|tara:strand:- start:586 stop:1437 length:852 start_codon:yes stop_codon:yes gene_type:complete